MTNRLIPAFTAVGALFLSGLGIALVFGLLAGGGAEPLLIVDPGPWVRWGIPMAKAFVHFGAALAVGSLMVAAGRSPSPMAFDADSGLPVTTVAL